MTMVGVCRLVRGVVVALAALIGVGGVCAGTVKVGLSLPQTGVQAGVGKEIEAGWRAFAKHANGSPMLGGHTLEVLVADDAFEPANARANAEQFAKQGVAVIASTTRCSRSISASMLSASNTSVRNSTAPEIPAGSPAWVQCSARENVRSIRATWVSAGSGVTCRSPKLSPAAGLLSCRARFCQANTTWISG